MRDEGKRRSNWASEKDGGSVRRGMRAALYHQVHGRKKKSKYDYLRM